MIKHNITDLSGLQQGSELVSAVYQGSAQVYPTAVGTETDSESRTRYSDWACDLPAVNGRKTRHRYTDQRTRTRTVYSNGTTSEWSSWSDWVQIADDLEESIDGISCPYILRYEYRNDRSNGSAYCEQSGGTNTGYLIQPRARDYCAVYSNGTVSVVRTESYSDRSYNTGSCPTVLPNTLTISVTGNASYPAEIYYAPINPEGDVKSYIVDSPGAVITINKVSSEFMLGIDNPQANFQTWATSANIDKYNVSGSLATFKFKRSGEDGGITAVFS